MRMKIQKTMMKKTMNKMMMNKKNNKKKLSKDHNQWVKAQANQLLLNLKLK